MENYNAVKFVEENIKTIFAYSLARVSNKADAEDLASEIMLAILQSGNKIKDPNAFYGFVWGIAANTYKTFLRKRNKTRYDELDENLPTEENLIDVLCAREDVNLLRRELSLLSREYRECTVAYYIDGLSCAQTAEKLGISLEMVKYYLFKTRKILKEGIGMEREYGEKSYNPAKFNFVTIFTGEFNKEYRNLFNRKLPGNIMLSAYYTPMTLRELSLELGVATPYLEDEIGLLEKYDLIRHLGGGKYQTNLVIFTQAFTEEFYKTAQKKCVHMLEKVLNGVKGKLPQIRKIGFVGAGIEDNRLMWAFLWMLMRNGYDKFSCSNPAYQAKDKLYRGATGINYGVDYDDFSDDSQYSCNSFAGYAGVDENYAFSFADFGVLPEKNRYCFKSADHKKMLYDSLNDPANAAFAVMTDEELRACEKILAQETDAVADIYTYLNDTATEIMFTHAPANVKEQIAHIVGNVIFFRTVGYLGACAAETGVIFVPEDDKAVALYAYKNGN